MQRPSSRGSKEAQCGWRGTNKGERVGDRGKVAGRSLRLRPMGTERRSEPPEGRAGQWPVIEQVPLSAEGSREAALRARPR